jgi:heme exporter protein D
MAPRRQADAAGPTNNTGGALGSPTTLLLILMAALLLFWNMRRRRAFEERTQAQRREQRLAEAEQSAREVANVMRTVAPSAAAAAAAEGLASAARTPEAPETDTDGAQREGNGSSPAIADAAGMRAIERAAGASENERAAVEQAQRAVYEAETRGPSETRRTAAAACAAAEVRSDDTEARGPRNGDAIEASGATSELPTPPAGAIAGDGTTACPPEFPIKGNASSRIYHEPGQSSYANTIPEFCFASAEAAEAAGFRQSRARGQRV